MDYKNIVAERIKENTELEVDLIEKLIEIPPKKRNGRLCFPMLPIS